MRLRNQPMPLYKYGALYGLLFEITRPYLLWNLTLAKKLLVNDKITAS